MGLIPQDGLKRPPSWPTLDIGVESGIMCMYQEGDTMYEIAEPPTTPPDAPEEVCMCDHGEACIHELDDVVLECPCTGGCVCEETEPDWDAMPGGVDWMED